MKKSVKKKTKKKVSKGKTKCGITCEANVTITESDPNGKKKRIVKKVHNKMTQAGLNAIMKQFANLIQNEYPAKIGVGHSSASPENPPSNLTNGVIKPIIVGDIIFQNNTIFAFVTYGANEANFSWNELGLCFEDETLIARYVDSDPYQKPATKVATVEWSIQVSEKVV